jgi:hypothetical protein
MKEVINTSRDTVNVSEVNSYKFYGFVQNHTNSKGFISRVSYGGGNYQMKAITELTEGNSWPSHSRSNLQGTIENLLNKNFTVYQFDTSKELFTWLAE